MTRAGSDYVQGLRDGRQVFINGSVVRDVTSHPAFEGSVRSIADLYDMANDQANRDVLTFESPTTGEPVNIAFMIPRSKEDLARRRRGLRRWSEQTFGLMGRSPDHVAGFLAGFASHADFFDTDERPYGANLLAFYQRVRDTDAYLTYVIAPPQIDRAKPAHQQADPHLYAGVKEQQRDGILVAGAQMLGTGAALADWILLSNIVPLAPGDENYAVTAAVPLSAPGLRIHARRSYAEAATSCYDYPLSTRYDESDSLVVFDDVFIPWEHVFAYRDLRRVREQWSLTPAHALGNNQAQIRLSTKLDFLVGIAKAVAEMNGTINVPAIQGVIGELSAQAVAVKALLLAQEENCLIDERGVAWPGIAEVNCCSTLQIDAYPQMVNAVRELCGGGLIQLPSCRDDFTNEQARADLDRYVQSPGTSSVQRVKLMKLAWDLVGSEFASRHQQYELFYAGAPHLVRARMFSSYDFGPSAGLVERALAGYDLDGRTGRDRGAS